LQRIRVQGRYNARAALDALNVDELSAKVAALTTVLEHAAAVLASASETESIYATAMERVFADPAMALLQRRLDDFGVLSRDGRLEALPESAIVALQASVEEARMALSEVAPTQLTRRRVEIPLVVSAFVAERLNDPEQRLRLDFIVPVGAVVAGGPATRLAARFGKGIRELVEYLDLPFMSVAVEQRGMFAGNSVVRVESIVSQPVDPTAATEAAEVMLESTITDDDALPMPILLMPQVMAISHQVVDALHLEPMRYSEPEAGSFDAVTQLGLAEAALRLGCSPLVAAVRLALRGIVLEDDGRVPAEALYAIRVAAEDFAEVVDGEDVSSRPQRELDLEGSARLGRGVYDSIRRDPELRRRATRGVLLRLVRENRWLPGAADLHDALRLLPPHLLGEGRTAIAELERAGWISRPELRRKEQIALIGLVPGHRDEILRYTRSGEGSPLTLATWVAAGARD
jgi:hypothetical protein